MSARKLHDGTPIPEHLMIAHQEADALVYEASRVGAALRDLAGAMSDPDDPLPDTYRPGMCVAVELIGDYLEGYAAAKQDFMERLAREDCARRMGVDAKRGKSACAEEVSA